MDSPRFRSIGRRIMNAHVLPTLLLLTICQLAHISTASTFDGDEWSNWSDWSSCTRTCDGGVTQQYRRCKSPNGCHGVSIRRKMCNMQPCSDLRDYRDEQCKAFNGIEFKGRRRSWEAIEDLNNPCALTCRAVGTDIIAKLSSKLRDGTRCKAGALHVCIDGRCEAVGCDLKLASPKKVDECGVCGGDGSTCSTPVYRWDVIPTTQCSATCGGGQQGVKVICRNSMSGERVDPFLCNSELKPYRAFKTCGTDPCQPTWITGEWSVCSRTCGGGLIIRKVSCVQVKNGTEIQVADKLCDQARKPINQDSCSMEPCPHWHAGPWSPCSTSCGPEGIKTRNVICRNSHNIPSSNCDPRLLPPSTRACTEEESPQCPTEPPTTTTPPPTTSTTTTTETSTEIISSSTTVVSEISGGAGGTWPSSSILSSSSSASASLTASNVVETSSPENMMKKVAENKVSVPIFNYPDDTGEVDDDNAPMEYALPLMQPYPPKSFVFESNTEPTFVADKWSPCSATCGEGVRRREVKCKIFLEFSRTIANLPDKDCPGPKPAETETCLPRPCPPPEDRPGGEKEELSEHLSDAHHAALADSGTSVMSNSRKTITVGLPPGITHQDMSFSWRVMGYTPCSASCLGGVQEVMIHCVRDYDQRIATPVLCFDKPQPDVATTRTCNDHSCPPRWNVSDFGPCSKSCGGGVMTREVNCIHEVTRGNTVIVPDNICPQPAPRTEKLCNTVNCPPFWEAGEWDRCSKPCGGGMRRRPIYCKQVIALGHVVEWPNPEGRCQQPRPIDYRACNKKPCGKVKTDKAGGGKKSNGDQEADPAPSGEHHNRGHFIQEEWKKKLSLSLKGQATVFQGVALKLRCPGNSKTPEMDRTKIVWKKDHRFMEMQKDKIQMVPKTGVLKIKNTTFSDSGIYTCLCQRETVTHNRGRKLPDQRGGYERDNYNRGIDRGSSRSGGRSDTERRLPSSDTEKRWFADEQLTWPLKKLGTASFGSDPGSLEASIPSSSSWSPGSYSLLDSEQVGEIQRVRGGLGSREEQEGVKLFRSWKTQVDQEKNGLEEEDDGLRGRDFPGWLHQPDSRHWEKVSEDEEEDKKRVEEKVFPTEPSPENDCEPEGKEATPIEQVGVAPSPGILRLRGRRYRDHRTKTVKGKSSCANNTNVKNANIGEWKTGSWSNCSETRCFTWNTSRRYRQVLCQLRNGSQATSTLPCEHIEKPVTQEDCYNNLCEAVWRTEPWSYCKSRCNAVGIKARIIKCVWFESMEPAGNACSLLPRPIVKKACLGRPCRGPGAPSRHTSHTSHPYPLHRGRHHHRHGLDSSRYHRNHNFDTNHNDSNNNNKTNSVSHISSSHQDTNNTSTNRPTPFPSDSSSSNSSPTPILSQSTSHSNTNNNFTDLEFFKNHFLSLQYTTNFTKSHLFNDIIEFFELYRLADQSRQGYQPEQPNVPFDQTTSVEEQEQVEED